LSVFSGHGSAMAQNYNHMIMPLADRKDKTTQVVWGIRDFRHRFGREPEAMWLAETAVDIETLEVLAEHGIRFTVLAPNQAARVRKIGAEECRTSVSAALTPRSLTFSGCHRGDRFRCSFTMAASRARWPSRSYLAGGKHSPAG